MVVGALAGCIPHGKTEDDQTILDQPRFPIQCAGGPTSEGGSKPGVNYISLQIPLCSTEILETEALLISPCPLPLPVLHSTGNLSLRPED
jgi:hypothetical protein